jgi:hypothetical protein
LNSRSPSSRYGDQADTDGNRDHFLEQSEQRNEMVKHARLQQRYSLRLQTTAQQEPSGNGKHIMVPENIDRETGPFQLNSQIIAIIPSPMAEAAIQSTE